MALNWIKKKRITEFEPEAPVAYIYPKAYGMPLEVRVRFVSHALHSGRPVLCIEIESDTTKANIDASWPEIKRLVKELDLLRGPWERPDGSAQGGGAEALYRYCWDNHQKGYTWSEIAAAVNTSIREAMQRPSDAQPTIPAWTLLDWSLGSKGTTWERDLAGLQPEDVIDDYPVTGDNLKAQVRTWRKRYGMGQ